jgi:hypothetical protein
MTLNLSLSPETEAKLRQRAAATGKDVAQFVEEAVQKTLSEPQPSTDPAQLTPAEQWERLKAWIDQMSAWTAKNLPQGHFVDDSRESIYEGCGE